jgi:hypothetical protein
MELTSWQQISVAIRVDTLPCAEPSASTADADPLVPSHGVWDDEAFANQPSPGLGTRDGEALSLAGSVVHECDAWVVEEVVTIEILITRSKRVEMLQKDSSKLLGFDRKNGIRVRDHLRDAHRWTIHRFLDALPRQASPQEGGHTRMRCRSIPRIVQLSARAVRRRSLEAAHPRSMSSLLRRSSACGPQKE